MTYSTTCEITPLIYWESKYTFVLLCLSRLPFTPNYREHCRLANHNLLQSPEFGFSNCLRDWLLLVIIESIQPLMAIFVILCAHDCNIVLKYTLPILHSKLLAVRIFSWALRALVRMHLTLTVYTYLLDTVSYSSFNISFVCGLVWFILRDSQPSSDTGKSSGTLTTPCLSISMTRRSQICSEIRETSRAQGSDMHHSCVGLAYNIRHHI